MSFEKEPHEREKEEPTEGDKSIPWSMVLTVSVTTLWGAGYLFNAVDEAAVAGVEVGQVITSVEKQVVQPEVAIPVKAIETHDVQITNVSAESPSGEGVNAEIGDASAGAAIYSGSCAGCHQASGTGLPGVFPPLVDSEWVIGKPRTLAAIVAGGYSGALTVNGVEYMGLMPAFGAQLDDKALADLLTYLRSEMNNVEGVSTDLIAEVRGQLPPTPFTDQSVLQEF